MQPENIEKLKNGGVGVIPTDTVYGLACSPFSKEALDKLFKIKGRDEGKPPVIIISEIADLLKFKAVVSRPHFRFMAEYWPGKVTIIFEVPKEFDYLDKGNGLAVRFPKDKKIQEFLRQTGPLATSSANPQGQPVARNISEAREYFKDLVDFYEGEEELTVTPSTLVDLRAGVVRVLRQGDVKVE